MSGTVLRTWDYISDQSGLKSLPFEAYVQLQQVFLSTEIPCPENEPPAFH